MAKSYNNKLRPRKAILECMFLGKIGKFDYTDEGVLWKDMPDEVLEEYAKVMSKKSVDEHLIGELQKETAEPKKVTEAPKSDKQ